MSEEELIEGLKQENRDAYKHAYYTYRNDVQRTIYKFVPVTEDAEELVQDVFVKAFKKIHQFEGRSGLRTWLIRISKNTALNFLISTKKQKEVIVQLTVVGDNEEEDQETYSDLTTPEELLIKEEDKALLLNAFTKLPPNQYTVCRLFYLEGLPQSDIADILDITLNAVESRIQRGKERLRIILKNTQINLTL